MQQLLERPAPADDPMARELAGIYDDKPANEAFGSATVAEHTPAAPQGQETISRDDPRYEQVKQMVGNRLRSSNQVVAERAREDLRHLESLMPGITADLTGSNPLTAETGQFATVQPAEAKVEQATAQLPVQPEQPTQNLNAPTQVINQPAAPERVIRPHRVNPLSRLGRFAFHRGTHGGRHRRVA